MIKSTPIKNVIFFLFAAIPTISNATPLSITTGTATDVLPLSAYLGGTINSDGGCTGDSAVGIEFGTTTSYGTYSVWAPHLPHTVMAGASPSFMASADGLRCNTVYHFRAKISNALGVAYGADHTFTSGACASVTTGAASSITPASAYLSGTVISNGGYSGDSNVGIEWGTSTAYGHYELWNPRYVDLGVAWPYSTSATTLHQNTVYHYRAKLSNPLGTVYGPDKTFTTPTCPTAGARAHADGC